MIILAALAVVWAPQAIATQRPTAPSIKLSDCRPALMLMSFPRDRQDASRSKVRPRQARRCMSLARA
jgi:hypothetical protein